MNTSSWGPRTWVYTHTVAQNYSPKDKNIYKDFFVILKDILPCKYCRASYSEFVKELPIDGFLGSKEDLTYWFYLIHNKVNDKLRNQGFIHTRNPSFKCIYKKYDRILSKADDPKAGDCMWYFLHAVSFNYDPALHQNPQDYARFFTLVGQTMPYPEIKPIYNDMLNKYPITNYLSCCESLSDWVYNIHKTINDTLGLAPLASYESIKAKFDAIKSSCNKDKKNVGTCRIPDSSTRCKASTIRGRQCIKQKKAGSLYCGQHSQLLKKVSII